MISKEMFISEIVKRTVPAISRKVLMESKLFSNENDELENIKMGYIRLLGQRYDVLSSTQKFIEMSPDEVIDKISKLDISLMNSLSLNQLKQMYLTDESLDRLRTMSSQAFEKAKAFYAGAPVIMVEDSEKQVDEMKKLIRFVKPHNRNTALLLFSEAAADLSYATGESDGVSIRFRDYIESDKNKEK